MLTLLSSGQGQSGTYVELMLQAYKLRVYAEAGVFEAEECLKASLNILDNYQVDPDAQLVRNYATRVRADSGTVEGFESTITSIKTLNNSDLHDKASLSLFPSGVKAGKAYSILPTNGNGDFTFNRSSTSSKTNRLGLIETVAIDIPTLNYPILGNSPELLLEPQATNKIINSVWANNGTVPNNWTLGVQGGVNSFSTSTKNINVSASNFDSTNGRVYFFQPQTININQTVAFSIYVESVTTSLTVANTIAVINIPGSAIYYKNSTLITSSTLIEANSTYTVVYTASGTATGEIRAGITNTGIIANLTISMPQLEDGSFATSFIPTTTSAVTRVSPRDIIVNGLDTKGITSANQGTIFLKLGLVDLILGGLMYNLSIGNSTTDRVAIATNAGNIRIIVTVAGVQVVNYTQTGISANNSNVAITYLNGVYKLFINGAIRFTSSAVTQNAYTSMQLTDTNAGGTIGSSRSIKSLLLYNTALTDAECVTLTTT